MGLGIRIEFSKIECGTNTSGFFVENEFLEMQGESDIPTTTNAFILRSSRWSLLWYW